MKHWVVVVRDCNGDETGHVGRADGYLLHWSAVRERDRYVRLGIPEPIPGRPLYTLTIEER